MNRRFCPLFKNLKEYEVCCHSVDDAVGEVYDKVARSMGIPYPGGAELDKMALLGDPSTYKMPVPKIDNFRFSGIKTWAMEIVKKLDPKLQTRHIDSIISMNNILTRFVESFYTRYQTCETPMG